MWLMHQHGFLSTVAFDPRKDRDGFAKRNGVETADTHLLVRARVREDLEDLKRHYVPDLLIEELRSADYSFRCLITREDFKGIMCAVVDEIDYDSHFKEAARAGSSHPTQRYEAYMQVWGALARLQPTAPYSGIVRGSTAPVVTYPSQSTWPSTSSGSSILRQDDDEEWTSAWWDAQDDGEAGAAAALDPLVGTLTTSEQECADMLVKKGTQEFTTSEMAALSDDAYELWFTVDDTFPESRQPVTSTQVAEVRSQLAQVREEFIPPEAGKAAPSRGG